MSDHLGERMSALIDGELTDAERDRVLAHLARCEPCRREASALRSIKKRMRALSDEATAADALTARLIALAALYAQAPRPRRPGFARLARHRRSGDRYPPPPRAHHRKRAFVVAGVAAVTLGIPTAAFVVGGSQDHPPQGPKVTPAVDVFLVQHSITTGEVPVQPASAGVPASPGAISQTP